MTAYATDQANVEIHPSGLVALPSGARITALPLLDRALAIGDGRVGFCRGSGAAARWLRARGMRLPDAEEYKALHALASTLHIEPVTLPTISMLSAAGIPATSTARVDAHRAANMSSRAWCEIHDREVYARLDRASWDGRRPVANAGKHIDRDGDIIGWWLAAGGQIQHESPAHRPPKGVRMEDYLGQLDYATTCHGVDDRDLKPENIAPATAASPRDAIRAWQKRLNTSGFGPLVEDGWWGPKTQAATDRWSDAQAPAEARPEMIPARNFTRVQRKLGDVKLIVLHSTETPVTQQAARNVALWFGGPSAPQASAHYVVGPDAVIACVEEHDVSWAAPKANRVGINIEMVGRAAKTDWLGDGRAVLERSAALVAGIARRWGIPIVALTAADVRDGKSGLCTHAAVTEAFGTVGGHVDPGMPKDRRWPWDEFLDLVRRAS